MNSDKVILIIDDDLHNIFALKLALKSRGYQASGCSSSKEGMEQLASNDKISLVLMDMMMPEIDGYEAMKMIRASWSPLQLPIIAVTAQAMAGDRERCLAAGANDYVSKPIDIDQLTQAIDKLSK